MFLDRAYLNIHCDIDSDGFPRPLHITLRGGRQLPIKGVMERGAVNTADGITTYRYDVWIEDASYPIYLINSIPLRWYVDVRLPFKVPPKSPLDYLPIRETATAHPSGMQHTPSLAAAHNSPELAERLAVQAGSTAK